jgi:hypothetical protein
MKSGEAYLRQLKKDLGLRQKDDVETIVTEKLDKVTDPGSLLLALIDAQEEASLVEQVLDKTRGTISLDGLKSSDNEPLMFMVISARPGLASSYLRLLIKAGITQDVTYDGCPTAIYAVAQDIGCDALALLTEVDFTSTIATARGIHNVLHEACIKDLDDTLAWLCKKLDDE